MNGNLILSVHESSHAVMVLYLGHRVEYAKIDPVGFDGGVVRWHYSKAKRKRNEHDLLIALAGPVGESILTGAAPDLAEGYAGQSDWDPRTSPDGYAYLVLRPERVQAWREVNELAGRTLMRDGTWTV